MLIWTLGAAAKPQIAGDWTPRAAKHIASLRHALGSLGASTGIMRLHSFLHIIRGSMHTLYIYIYIYISLRMNR